MAGIKKKVVEKNAEFILRLYITGANPNSLRAVTNIKLFCETNLQGRYSLEIIDVFQQPELAKLEQIVALPMLVKEAPLPERRLIGDLSDTYKILKSFGLQENEAG